MLSQIAASVGVGRDPSAELLDRMPACASRPTNVCACLTAPRPRSSKSSRRMCTVESRSSASLVANGRGVAQRARTAARDAGSTRATTTSATSTAEGATDHGADGTGADVGGAIAASSASSPSTSASAPARRVDRHDDRVGRTVDSRRDALQPCFLRLSQLRPSNRASLFCTDTARTPSRSALGAQAGDVEQRGRRRRRRSVAVVPFGPHVVDVVDARDRREPPVRLHAHVVARDVVARQVRGDRQVDLHLGRRARALRR